ncbi:DUF1365 domain-containing protein [Desertibaculum subflavum]|uniref:DUF1365 domain-containing protein n=1 Tax=Desertibaculum subflavum TaxID=2268458 RepID=UPI000E663779
MSEPAASLYVGEVKHRRLRPFAHRFAYRVFSICLDIDRVSEVAGSSRLFGYNTARPFAFHDRDHGPRDGSRLRPWVERQLRAADLPADGAIRLLCFPRIFGYVFNPLSVFFCHDRAGRLVAILHEVKNTFGEQHAYLIPVAGEGIVRQEAQKQFHVSPFIGMDCRYRFRIRPPGERMSIAIRQSDAAGDLLIATHRARRLPFGDLNLLKCLATHPLMAVKVIGAIHWEGLRLWIKGARLHQRPPAPAEQVTLGRAE